MARERLKSLHPRHETSEVGRPVGRGSLREESSSNSRPRRGERRIHGHGSRGTPETAKPGRVAKPHTEEAASRLPAPAGEMPPLKAPETPPLERRVEDIPRGAKGEARVAEGKKGTGREVKSVRSGKGMGDQEDILKRGTRAGTCSTVGERGTVRRAPRWPTRGREQLRELLGSARARRPRWPLGPAGAGG